MWKEFKEFAMRGNVIDMAIGIIIGAAFSKLITSLVNDILMPPLGFLIGNVDFSNFAITLRAKTAELPAVVISYGSFINTIINFLIVAFAMFIVIKQMNRFNIGRKDAPKMKACPYCCSSIAMKAIRCPNCTQNLEGK
ncbi:MAG TPA: large-conductance mechanosensitive channel protein MscL [Gammaproteobacteria bacterium]|nr:large-conductance mechanosensitive channel protein MscL [Gammaproteobacteria bacterium]